MGTPRKYYAIYRRDTGELVADGTAADCAEQMGVSMSYVYSLISNARNGKRTEGKTYRLYEEDY